MKVVVDGASCASDLPGFDPAKIPTDVLFAPDGDHLKQLLPEAEVILGWNFRGRELRDYWELAGSVKWIHRCGAGVDALLFPALVESDVVVTNARGVFDRAMAEYVLGYMLYALKQFPATLQAQTERRWDYKITDTLAGQRAAIFGVGSIGRELAGTLKMLGVEVIGIGRSRREDDLFGTVYANSDAMEIVPEVDWVIGILPSTPESNDTFTRDFFSSMKFSARFINIGRGNAQDESALVAALENGEIAGAMIDVFREEPLPASSGLWGAPNLFLSPHMSGDYSTFEVDLVKQFLDNLQRYVSGDPLKNVVDKKLGFVAS